MPREWRPEQSQIALQSSGDEKGKQKGHHCLDVWEEAREQQCSTNCIQPKPFCLGLPEKVSTSPIRQRNVLEWA